MVDDARFRRLRERLDAAFGHVGDPPVGRAERGQAGVALVFRSGPEPELLLIRRARSERDPWSGHMALPGGRRDLGDPTLRRTAERETLEETGISLDAGGRLLGRMAPVMPQGPGRPGLSVFPFVYAVPDTVQARPVSHEVDAVFWVREGDLLDPTNRVIHELKRNRAVVQFPAVEVHGQVVWGLTWRILTTFFETVI